jgi:hypothetical protein
VVRKQLAGRYTAGLEKPGLFYWLTVALLNEAHDAAPCEKDCVASDARNYASNKYLLANIYLIDIRPIFEMNLKIMGIKGKSDITCSDHLLRGGNYTVLVMA